MLYSEYIWEQFGPFAPGLSVEKTTQVNKIPPIHYTLMNRVKSNFEKLLRSQETGWHK